MNDVQKTESKLMTSNNRPTQKSPVRSIFAVVLISVAIASACWIYGTIDQSDFAQLLSITDTTINSGVVDRMASLKY